MIVSLPIIALVLAFLFSPHLATITRRITVSIASEVKQLKDEVAQLQASPAPAFDSSSIESQIAALQQQIADLAALVGTPSELNPNG